MFGRKRKKLSEAASKSHASTGLSDIWYRFRKNKLSMAGLIVVVIIILIAIFADVLADYDTMAIEQHPEIRLQGPSADHIFGTDAYGRDMFARIIHGARYSLTFALACTAISMVGGTLVGAAASYAGGIVDNVIMRILDAFYCMPGMLLTISLSSALGMGLKSIIIALSISGIPGYARIVRSVMLGISQQEYIEAARACGFGGFRIITRHMVPNAISILIVNAMMSMAGLIMSAAALSYIGMGIQPPAPEWGAMLQEGQTYMREYFSMVLVPGLAIVITALAFNLLGDGLSEALDPRMKD